MAFFDELAKKVSDVTHTVESKGRDLADITKLNFRIAEEERKLDDTYKEIGKSFVEKFGDKASGSMAVLIEEIREHEKAVADYKRQLRELKGVTLCKSCGAELSSDAVFCAACGEKKDTEATEE